MPGFSLTILLLPRDGSPDSELATASQVLDLLDAPCDAPGWSWHSKSDLSPINIRSAPPVIKDLGHGDTGSISVRRAYAGVG